jgi:hypothetical protein
MCSCLATSLQDWNATRYTRLCSVSSCFTRPDRSNRSMASEHLLNVQSLFFHYIMFIFATIISKRTNYYKLASTGASVLLFYYWYLLFRQITYFVNIYQKLYRPIFSPKDGGSMLLRNICICLRVHTALKPRRTTSYTWYTYVYMIYTGQYGRWYEVASIG